MGFAGQSNPYAFGPQLWQFDGNAFTCTAPLNGTIDGITEIGVSLQYGQPLITNGTKGNRFEDLANGIYGENNLSPIIVVGNNFTFRNMRKHGVRLYRGSYFSKGSTFENFGIAGISIQQYTTFEVEKNTFIQRKTDFIDNETWCVKLSRDADNLTKTNVKDCSFDIDFDIEDEAHLKCTGLSASYASVVGNLPSEIVDSKFKVNGTRCRGIYLYAREALHYAPLVVRNNSFFISGGLTQDDPSFGIDAHYEDEMYIVENTFTAHHFRGRPIDDSSNRELQNSHGLSIGGGDFGNFNLVANNLLHDDVHSLSRGFGFRKAKNITICSNTIHYDGKDASGNPHFDSPTTIGFTFSGINDLTFSENEMLMGGSGFIGTPLGNAYSFFGDGILIWSDGVTGTHTRKANKWKHSWKLDFTLPDGYVLPGPYPFWAARVVNPNMASVNKFIIQEEQSTCYDSREPCYNPYHPALISPNNNIFFEHEPGDIEPCFGGFLSEEVDPVHITIARNQLPMVESSPFLNNDAQRMLFQKLHTNLELKESNIDFLNFYNEHKTSNIGKFIEAYAAIFKGDSFDETSLVSELNQMNESLHAFLLDSDTDVTFEYHKNLTTNILQLLSNITNAGNQIHILSMEKANLALGMYNEIVPENEYESSEKQIAQVVLNARLNQEGELTLEERNFLINLYHAPSSFVDE